MKLRTSLWIVLAAQACGGCSNDPAPPATKPAYKPALPWNVSIDPANGVFSTLKGRHVCLMPSKIRFSLPEWWFARFERKVSCTAAEIKEATQRSTGTCDQFRGFCNSAFPNDRCALAAVDWGIRVYDLAEPLDEARKRIGREGADEVRAFKTAFFIEHAHRGDWYRMAFTYFWDNGEDLMGNSQIVCLLRAWGDRTLVFCFEDRWQASD